MKLGSEVKTLNKLLATQLLTKADSIIWLQGDRFDRGPKTLELYKKHFSLNIVIVGNNKLLENSVQGGKLRPNEKNVSLSEMENWLTERGVKKSAITVIEDAHNTYEQALKAVNLAIKRKWSKIIIVGSWPYYQFRAFLTFLMVTNKLQWHGKILNQFVVQKLDSTPGGRKYNVEKLMQDEIKKLEKYKNHILPPIEGIKYLQK